MDGGISYTRQLDWFDPSAHPGSHVTLVGVGGIGSPTALALAKLGIEKLTLIDPDTVERHNLPNQMFPLLDSNVLGELKVFAVKQVIEAFAATSVSAHEARAVDGGLESHDGTVRTDLVPLRDVVVVSPDNMQARKDAWQLVKGNPYVPLLIDGRMGGQSILVYAVDPRDPDDQEYYESKLYTDEEARDLSCTAAAVIDVGFAVASLITRAVRRHYAGTKPERMVFLDQANLIIGKE